MDRGCRFRLFKRSRSEVIQIREWHQGKTVTEFSSQIWNNKGEKDVEAACIAADKAGLWKAAMQQVQAGALTWLDLADMDL